MPRKWLLMVKWLLKARQWATRRAIHPEWIQLMIHWKKKRKRNIIIIIIQLSCGIDSAQTSAQTPQSCLHLSQHKASVKDTKQIKRKWISTGSNESHCMRLTGFLPFLSTSQSTDFLLILIFSGLMLLSVMLFPDHSTVKPAQYWKGNFHIRFPLSCPSALVYIHIASNIGQKSNIPPLSQKQWSEQSDIRFKRCFLGITFRSWI